MISTRFIPVLNFNDSNNNWKNRPGSKSTPTDFSETKRKLIAANFQTIDFRKKIVLQLFEFA